MQFMDYIMGTPTQVQGTLLDILQVLQKELPEAEQRIYHGIPTLFHNGHDIFCVGAYKDHFGLYMDIDTLEYLKKNYPAYSYSKGAMQIPYTQPFPHELLSEICRRLKAQIID